MTARPATHNQQGATEMAYTKPHDSDAWETVSGWLWACRTCLTKGWAHSEAHAQEMRARHDAGPVPWWVERITRSQP